LRAAAALIKLRAEYLEAKNSNDKEGMRAALLSTYNPASGFDQDKQETNSREKMENLQFTYPDPYRRKPLGQPAPQPHPTPSTCSLTKLCAHIQACKEAGYDSLR